MSFRSCVRRVVYGNYALYVASHQLVYFFKKRVGGGVKIVNRGCAKLCKDVVGKNNCVYIGEGSLIHKMELYVRGKDNTVEIGKSCIIGHNCSIRIEGNGCNVSIGDGTTMTRDIHICVQEDGMSITVGKDCMFSNNIIVRTSDSHPIYKDGQRINPPAPIVIGNHVWIAPETTILKGVTVGDNCILASKSLLTKSVAESCLVAGLPAKVVKTGVNWTRESLY